MIRKIFLGILDSVFIIVFNLVFFFSTGTEHLASVWITYAFAHIAYILFFLTPLFSKREKVFSLPLGVFSTVHFAAQLIVAIVFMIIEPYNYILPLLINIVLMGIYLVALFSTLAVNDKDYEKLEYIDAKKSFIEDCSAILKSAYNNCDNRDSAQVINKAYYTLHSSPVVSSEQVKEIEIHILYLVNCVDEAVKNNHFELAANYANEIIAETDRRNVILSSTHHK